MSDVESEFGQLVEIVAKLRGENGCPWDKKQTPATLKKYLLEECDELVTAIENKDTKNICEEIGDLYFILAMLSTLYHEKDDFSLTAPLLSINEKMVRRHPHVFSDVQIHNEEQLHQQWQTIKEREKQSK